MELLEITGLQRGCVSDGPGVRTTIFFRGCMFKCPWCCNPETMSDAPVYFIDEQSCLLNKKISSKLCTSCIRLGGEINESKCPFNFKTSFIKYYDTETLFEILRQDFPLMRHSGGGVTFSGGDPILQLKSIFPLLKKLKDNEIRTAIETTLYLKQSDIILSGLSLIDTWIIDLKLQPINISDDYISTLTHNIKIIQAAGKEVIFRLVHIPKLRPSDISAHLKYLRITQVELLKCHSLAQKKYEKLGLEFTDYSSSDYEFALFSHTLEKNGIEVLKPHL